MNMLLKLADNAELAEKKLGSLQCISIPKCDKAIKSHLRSFGAGFADFFLREQACINTEIFGNVNAVGFLLKPLLASVSMILGDLGRGRGRRLVM